MLKISLNSSFKNKKKSIKITLKIVCDYIYYKLYALHTSEYINKKGMSLVKY